MSKMRYMIYGVLLLLACSLAACGQKDAAQADVSVDVSFTPNPPQVGPTRVELVLQDADGEPVTEAEVHLEGNMNHPGMLPVLADAPEVAAGRYQVELEFTMAGDWYLIVEVVLSDGRTLEEQIDVPGVKQP